MRRRGLPVADKESASLRLHLGARPHERLALPVDVAKLFLLLAWHTDHRQLARVAIDITREPLTKRGRIARVGFHPRALPSPASEAR